MYVVYALEDPRDHLYHYVGITDDVYRRLSDHIKGSAGNVEKTGWIFECRQANIMILMREIERVHSRGEAEQREHFWVFYYLQLGHPLSNLQHAKSIQEEKSELEKRYLALLASKAALEEQIHALTKEDALPIEQRTGMWGASPSTADVMKILELRQRGFSLRSIVKATGIRYHQVRKVGRIG